jgi:signal transduction histidine kinase
MLFGNVVGLVNHAAFLAIFISFGVDSLALFNAFSVCLFAFNLVLQKRRGSTSTTMVLASAEVILHQVVAVIVLGWGCGFQFYLIVIPSLLFLGNFKRRVIPIGLSALSVAVLAWLWLHGQYVGAPHQQIPETAMLVLFGMNLISTATLVSVFSLIYHRSARQNEEALERAREATEAASKAKSTFLANMSHELRTPLNAIIGYSEMLEESADEPDDASDLQKIRDAGRHLLGLIDDILDLSKIEAGKLETVVEPFAPHELLQTTESMFLPLVAEKPVELSFDVDSEIPAELVGDPLRLRQVLTNLVGNAIKFTEEGSVRVTAAMSVAGEGAVQIEFSVEDTGVGIDSEQLQQIFEPFAQADANVQRKFGGTGLGLSISRRLVDIMGGSFEAHSEPGRGSRFAFRLSFDRPA